MKLVQFLKAVVMLTVLALIYIHLQVQIFDLAYQGKKKEKQIHALTDVNHIMTSHVLALKSANHLGVRLLSEESSMDFLKTENVVQLQTPLPWAEANELAAKPTKSEKPGLLAGLFSLRSQAEAQSFE